MKKRWFRCPECDQDMREGPQPGRRRCPRCGQALPRKPALSREKGARE